MTDLARAQLLLKATAIKLATARRRFPWLADEPLPRHAWTRGQVHDGKVRIVVRHSQTRQQRHPG